MSIIAYYRVSTKRQSDSGLGLDAQKATVETFARGAGEKTLAAYIEVESGKLADRPQLKAAIAHARRAKAKLVIAKLDRLSRNVAFLATLMDSGVDFIACDNPNANRLTLHILAAVAENEAKAISDRTKVALAQAKKRGTALGSARPGHWDGREKERLAGAMKGNKVSAEVRRAKAMAGIADLLPLMKEYRKDGESLPAIAKYLNESGQQTTRGGKWTPMAVKRVLDRAAEV